MNAGQEEFALLLARIERLERANRSIHLFWVMLAFGILVAISAGMVSSAPAASTSVPIALRDEQGTVRAAISLEDGVPGLRLFDEAGRKRLELEVWKKGAPHINLINEQGTVQAELSLTNGDLPWLILRSKRDEDLANLGINAYGSPSLEMSNAKYDHHLDLTFFDDGLPKLKLYGADYEERAVLSVIDTDRASLELKDKTGRTIFQAPDDKRRLDSK